MPTINAMPHLHRRGAAGQPESLVEEARPAPPRVAHVTVVVVARRGVERRRTSMGRRRASAATMLAAPVPRRIGRARGGAAQREAGPREAGGRGRSERWLVEKSGRPAPSRRRPA
ncbi:MAG TPA: hypothetical protein VHE35_29570, partial [Kofleriaceae bacterium]|nr:hypothetical protein [Kofleriaceae bacterium]